MWRPLYALANDLPPTTDHANRLYGAMTKKEQKWGTAQDEALLNEVDDLIRKKMLDFEKSGADMQAIIEMADRYGHMFDMLDTRMAGLQDNEPQDMKEAAYFLLEELLFEKLEKIYYAQDHIDQDQAKKFIHQTRRKLQRIEEVLFGRKRARPD